MKTKPKSKINVRLLRAIQRQIAKEPEQFCMSSWFLKNDAIPNCGTSACIAGWAVTVSQKTNPLRAAKSMCPRFEERDVLVGLANDRVAPKARRLLGLSLMQGELLFYKENWPEQFCYDSWGITAKERALLAIARIDHFIATNGEE